MDSIPSTVFRTQYSALTEPTIVTVNGHAIGTWLPGPFADTGHGTWTQTVVEPVRAAQTRQAARDAILRKINKG